MMPRAPWRRAGKRLSLWLPVVAVAALLLALNLWAARNLGRMDLTAQRLYSLAPESVEVARQIKQPVTVTWFYDLRNKSMVDALELLRQYEHANPLIRVRGVDPALRPAELTAVLAACTAPSSFVIDQPGTGTTLLAAAPGVALDPRFGVGSALAHQASGAVSIELAGIESVRRDVDTAADLAHAVQLGVGPATADVMSLVLGAATGTEGIAC